VDMCHHLAAPSFVNTVVCFQGLNLLVSDGDIFNRRFTSVSVSFYQAVFLLLTLDWHILVSTFDCPAFSLYFYCTCQLVVLSTHLAGGLSSSMKL